ncbi:MAG: L-threonylcarbamoyladenylate synthase, partial [Akkermansiaceae bacterium]|nr:L-threonylcarbamoyladenylate synthase [Akkermansiaceae bacterium]
KKRPASKPIPVLLADAYALEQIVQNPSRQVRLLTEAFWPGPLTIVWPKVPGLPEAVSSEPTVGVRVPDHEFARQLLRRVGPLAVSSANRSGAATTRTAREVLAQLSGRIHLVIDGGISSGRRPSTVVGFEGKEFKILRQGPIRAEEIQRVLG